MSIDSSGGLVLGIDSSTSAVKAVAWTAAGLPVAAGRTALDLHSPQPDFYEQDAEQWWVSTCEAIRQVLVTVPAANIKAVCIAHQRETFVPLGKDLKPLRPAITWLDQRAREILPELALQLEPVSFQRRTGKPLSANLAPPKIAWLRRFEPGLFAETAYWLDTHAFLVNRLTGRIATSTASADPLGLYDLLNQEWDQASLSILGIDFASLPHAYAPGSILGTITPLAAEATGLKTGTLVAAGMGDGQAAALGIGIQNSGQFSLSLGTSVIGGVFSPAYVTSSAFRTMGGPPGVYILETVILSGTHLINWLVRDLLGRQDVNHALAELEKSAAAIPPGSNGMLLVPYWNGAMNPYWDASASGIVIGLRGHHRPAHFFRAALEGIAFELHLHILGVEAALGSELPGLTASGGGVHNPLWLQIIADVTGKPVACNEENEATSLGAAILAASASEMYPDVSSAAKAMTSASLHSFSPNPAKHALYTRLFDESYRHLYPAVQGHLIALNRVTEK